MRIGLTYLPLVTVCISLACTAAPTLDDLYAQQTVLQQVEQDYKRRSGSLSAGEADDYQAYITGLRDRLMQDCNAVRSSGTELPADIECPGSAAAGLAPVRKGSTRAATRGEQTDSLDAELEAGLGDYDDLLLTEQARVKAEKPRSDVGDGGGDGFSGGAEGETGGETDSAGATGGGQTADARATETGQTTTDGSEGQQTGAGGQQTGVGGQQTGTGGQPADIPDGDDDDVVARQLRKAAEQETDPELKKKLWEEYRKYKQGTGSQ